MQKESIGEFYKLNTKKQRLTKTNVYNMTIVNAFSRKRYDSKGIHVYQSEEPMWTYMLNCTDLNDQADYLENGVCGMLVNIDCEKNEVKLLTPVGIRIITTKQFELFERMF